MTRRIVVLGALAVGIVALLVVWQGGRLQTSASSPDAQGHASALIQRGGTLVCSIRSEPRSFNRYANRDTFTDLFSLLTQAKLVRVNRATQQIEPQLAERWTASADGLSYTLSLRRGVTFADGAPFTADDVVFAFAANYDKRSASPLADSLTVNGQPLRVTATDPTTVVIVFPAPYGPGLRILDNLPILPKHRLREALDRGALRSVWTPATPASDITGLGPFVFREYQAGERVVFARNPRYWRRDANGMPLPYLDGLTLDILPDQNAELLRLQAGQLDVTQGELRPEDYLPLKRAADQGKITLREVGVGLDADAIWFSLKRELKAEDPRQPWLQSEELRHAISLAVDRRAFADTVFLGAAEPLHGPVTSGNQQWFDDSLPDGAYDPAKARALLAGLGLKDVDSDGMLEDRRGGPARFALLVVKGNTAFERGASVLREDLARVGIAVDVVALEFGAFIDRLIKGDFDAVYYRLQTTDTDPAVNLDFWLSSGSAHVWNIAQPAPSTPWERAIDQLMRTQTASTDLLERRRLFNQVQRVFVEHLPGIFFVAPRVYVATSARVTNVTPGLLRPQLLWNADSLAVRRSPGETH